MLIPDARGAESADKRAQFRGSEFNALIEPTADTPYLFYNSLTQSLVALSYLEAELITPLLSLAPLPDTSFLGQLEIPLRRLGYLVAAKKDERRPVIRQLDAIRFAERGVGLTLMTTLQCNLACRYCFQTRVSSSMSVETADLIVARYAPLAADSERLHITWFGGEPLLNTRVIERVTAGLRPKFKVFDSDIITNGVLLDAAQVDFLARNGVTKAQITVDGPKIFHDRRRPFRGGQSSYEQILANLISASKHLGVVVRVNTDAELARMPDELADFLLSIDTITEHRAAVDFAIMVGIGDRESTVQHANITQREFSASIERVYAAAIERGYRGRTAWPTTARGCIAINNRGLVIGPDGSLFRCWEEPGGPNEQSVGHIGRQGRTPTELAHEMRYLGFDEHHSDKCKTCRFQPVCGSGCPRVTLTDKHGTKEDEVCEHTYTWVPAMARTRYRMRRAMGSITPHVVNDSSQNGSALATAPVNL